MSESSTSTKPRRPVLAATPARQGRFGRHMFWVLLISTSLAAIGLVLAWTSVTPWLHAYGGGPAAAVKDAPAASAPQR